jgi:hypothetical protein
LKEIYDFENVFIFCKIYFGLKAADRKRMQCRIEA